MEKDKLYKSVINRLSTVVNRSIGQTKFLLELCEYDFENYCMIEEKIKRCLISYCPGDWHEITKILDMKDKTVEGEHCHLDLEPYYCIGNYVPSLDGTIIDYTEDGDYVIKPYYQI
jgi:hypothetical protein